MNFRFVTDWFAGKTTFFCLAFFVSGNICHHYHRLDATYISFMVALMGFVIGRSIQADINDRTTASPDTK